MIMQERCLGAIRLSVLTDASTSPERQQEYIERAAAQRDGRLVGVAKDLDVSASKVPPMERPGLGPWFAERKDEWDTLIVWRLDRLVRKVGDLAELIKWCEENGKNIVSATEPFDLSTPLGKALVYLVAVFAEMEASAIRERVTGAHKALRSSGRWGGGTPIFGTKPVPNPDGNGWVLDVDPKAQALLMEIVERVVGGESMNSVAYDLNQRKVPAPRDFGRVASGKEKRGTLWTVTTMGTLLRSPALRGIAMHKGKVVRGEDGMPIKRGPELLSQNRFDAVQAAIDRRSFKRGVTEPSPLLNVALCGLCGRPLYKQRQRRGEKVYTYYKCPTRNMHRDCETRNCRAEDLEQIVEEALLDEIGSAQVTRQVYVKGADHQRELAEVEQAMADLRADRAAGLFKGERGSAEFRRTYAGLEARREELEGLEPAVAGVRFESTGQTWEEAWSSSDEQKRRALLLDAGIQAVVQNVTHLSVALKIPENILARLTLPAEAGR
ncbi:integrase [Pilimelia anulata]|uniref:Integrase n=1 Tax=Pilimelia anulata TaxID=53371 RepID=A0A8J3AZA1_9ACTN|nr:recombinase family protein [Pilimelia anulata]GGJ75932.1 integrase [Pilimelia anulata]